MLADVSATFTGFLHGRELAQAYASANVKVFPSTTDTWGNAVLEAQSSGLPVIVSNEGGPQELMLHEVTGLRVKSKDPAELCAAMLRLMDPALRTSFGEQARVFVEANRVDAPYSEILDFDAGDSPAKLPSTPTHGVPHLYTDVQQHGWTAIGERRSSRNAAVSAVGS